MKTFDDWFNEPELYGVRSERLHAILEPKQWDVVEKWLTAAYYHGREDEHDDKSLHSTE